MREISRLIGTSACLGAMRDKQRQPDGYARWLMDREWEYYNKARVRLAALFTVVTSVGVRTNLTTGKGLTGKRSIVHPGTLAVRASRSALSASASPCLRISAIVFPRLEFGNFVSGQRAEKNTRTSAFDETTRPTAASHLIDHATIRTTAIR